MRRGTRKLNRAEILGDVTKLFTSRGREILIDTVDHEFLKKYSWCVNSGGYALANNLGKSMHRILLNASQGSFVDHINGNRLDNRRSNLRFATRRQNSANLTKLSVRNKSGYRGVSLDPGGLWVAQGKIARKSIYLGLYKNATEAAKVVDRFLVKTHGEFHGLLNFPDKKQEYMNE